MRVSSTAFVVAAAGAGACFLLLLLVFLRGSERQPCTVCPVYLQSGDQRPVFADTPPGQARSVLDASPPPRTPGVGRVAVLTMDVWGTDPRGPRRRTQVVTYSDKTADIGDISIPNMRRYTEHHGYDLLMIDESLDATRPLAWSKIRGMLQALDEYDWVLYMDVDALFANYSVTVESVIAQAAALPNCANATPEFIVASNNKTLNSGVMMAKNTANARALLQAAYDQYRSSWNGLQDNRAIIDLLQRNMAPPFACLLWDEHAHLLQSYPRTTSRTAWANFKPGHWIVHLTGPCAPWCRIAAQLVNLCATYPLAPECRTALTLDGWQPMSSYGNVLPAPPSA